MATTTKTRETRKTELPEAEQGHVHAAEHEPEPEGALFDRSTFNDPRLILEDERGNKIDEIEITFTGKIKLNRTDPDSVAYVKQIILSRYNQVDFEVSGVWVERKVRITPENPDTGTGGERILTVKAQIDSIDVSTPTTE